MGHKLKLQNQTLASIGSPASTVPSKQIVLSARASQEVGAIEPDEPAYALRVTGAYQDSVTRDWAIQRCCLGTQQVGEEQVKTSLFSTQSLNDPGILLDAVHAAVAADVIVVSVYAADELPLEIYVWIDLWLPRRRWRAGALAALVGVAEPLDAPSVRTHEYLQAVARKGQLDFIPQESKRPVTYPVHGEFQNMPQ
jgi:hypothetical protein